MTPIYDIPTWTEENRSLHDAICQARVSKDSADALKQLLQMNKAKFLHLLDNEPKNSTHRANLNANKAYINRTSHNVSKEFVTKSLFISDQLNINEYVAATLLMRGTKEFSRVNSNSVDTAVVLYHGERGYLLACLDVILKTVRDVSTSDEINFICYQFISELISEKTSHGQSQSVSFVTKLLMTLEDLSKTINSIIKTGTVTNQLPNTGSGKLGEDISELRIQRLSDERVYIVQILYHIVSLFEINADEKIKMLELLEEAELSDMATSYMLIAMISALSSQWEPNETSSNSSNLEFVDQFHNRIMSHGSKVPVIKGVIVLQWITYLSNPSRKNAVIGDAFLGRTETDIQQLLDHAIATDVFGFMNEYLLYFQQHDAMINTDRRPIKQDIEDEKGSTKIIDTTNYHNFNADIRNDFQPFVVFELERLGLEVISNLFDVLQKFKYKEEDLNVITQNQLAVGNPSSTSSQSSTERYNLQSYLTFLASVFRNRINGGAIFWSREAGGMNHFIRWLLDIKVIGTISAAYDFFGSIATGDIASNYMHNFLRSNTEADIAASSMFSWGKPFSALKFYIDLLGKSSEESKLVIPAIEEQLLLKFMILLKECVQYSVDARVYFWTEAWFPSRNILVDFISCSTSTVLRAALFDVLAAFCSSWGGGVRGIGLAISGDMWRIMSNSDMMISSRKFSPDRSQSTYHVAGILQELKHEKISQIYAETLSVIRLIGSAIHTQSKLEVLQSGFRIVGSSIPEDLNRNSKNPGCTSFISLVVDEIFVFLGTHKYRFPEARWELTEACLAVMEYSLDSFDVHVFETEVTRKFLDRELESLSYDPNVEFGLLKFLLHPGFQVIIRILVGGRVIDELFSVIEKCAKKESKEVEYMPYHKKCLVRSLRILHRVLKIQDIVCKVIIPYLSGFSKKKSSSEFQLAGYTFPPLPSVVPLGQLFLFNANILTQIALLVNYEDQEEVCFLSTEILSLLSKCVDNNKKEILPRATVSVPFSGLGSSIASVLKSSNLAETIIFGFSERLRIDIPEVTTYDDYEYDVNNIPFWLAEETMNNLYNYSTDFKPRVSSSVQIAILDLLLNNTTDKSSLSLTEFLLGYDAKNEYSPNQIQDTASNKASLVSFHAILDMLRQGLEKSSVDDIIMEDTIDVISPLVDTHPILAEKCYELIYRLCSKKSLSLSTLRYLRNREDFFYKQFEGLSARIEHGIEVKSAYFGGKIVCADGFEYYTDFFRLRSRLQQRAWLLRSIALELHTTVKTKNKNETNRLIELLYGHKSTVLDDHMDTPEDPHGSDFFSICQPYEQPLVKMLELVSSLEFSWVDDLLEKVEIPEVAFYDGFDNNAFLTTNKKGCEIYDVREIFRSLVQYREGKINDQNRDLANKETENILSWAVAQNHRREITHAKLHCLNAWKEVVHITLVECSDLIPQQFRESIIYELITMILPKIIRAKDFDGNLLKSMSEIVLTLVDQLRSDKSDRQTSRLPVEKLQYVFGGIVNCIHQEDTTINIRGDLYSAITSFLLYIKTHNRDSNYLQLENFIVNTISTNNAKLLHTICNDAFNEFDIWKTTAYIVLDALNTLALRANSNVVQSALTEKNFLQYTINTIRSDDAALTNLLEQTDAPLLPLYIFEAKMSILLRLAMNPVGAELLFSNQIFEVLGQCQFMKAQILDSTATEMDVDASTELAERYQQLVMPTLKLIVALLCCYKGKNNVVLLKAEGWARRQQSALVNMLQYNRRPITIVSLEQLKLITTILYFISHRPEYFNDFINRGINQLHNSMIQLEVSNSLAGRVIPMTIEEQELDKTTDTANGYSSLLEARASKIIKFVNNNLRTYKSKKVNI